ncbi:immunoglobulin-like and fibronectin type III domain-containing protein 1 [Cottoperca gobio]|uniref:immunoglobulin-like and fibronectin type III domain-containing protein 1 n=1 Tax=Cottoperca gobio TaxID=56716 RepID=UPI00110D9EA5|nr:immunoglobulin-like and fibronectin type III domain-containing protein 1 [Cottoperca gobio]
MITQFVVDIPEGKSTPDFQSKPIPVTIKEGTLAVFKVMVNGDPKPEVTWRRTKGPTTDKAKFQCKYDESTGEHILQIVKVSGEESDTYKCYAANEYGKAVCSTSLNVIEVGKNPSDFRKMLRRSKVEEKAESDERFWDAMLNADRKEYERICNEFGVADFHSILKKLEDKKKERAQNKCKGGVIPCDEDAKEKHLKSHKNAARTNDFNVKGLMQKGTRRQQVDEEDNLLDAGLKLVDEEVNRLYAEFTLSNVDFVIKIQELKAQERDDALFACVLTHPLPRITWMGKSSALEDGEKYSINVSEHKLIHRLLIKDCNQLDNGIYSAVAGITSCSARLVVQAEGDPASAGRPRKTTVGGGAQIDLEEVAREQQIKNREEMEKMVDEEVNRLYAEFTLSNVDFVIKIQELKAQERDDALFACVLTHPLPRITWMGKSSALEDGEKYSINVSEHKLIHRLLIKDCNQLDNGIYSAVAGITSCNARLVVQAEGDPASAGRPRKTTVGGGAQIDLEEVAREQQIKNREEMEKMVDEEVNRLYAEFTLCPSTVSMECVHGVCPSSVSMECVHRVCPSSVSIECVLRVCPSSVSIECVHGVCPWSVSMECVHGVCPSSVSIKCVLRVCPWSVSIECVHRVCPSSVSMECVHGVCPSSVSIECVHRVCPSSVSFECVHRVCPSSVSIECVHRVSIEFSNVDFVIKIQELKAQERDDALFACVLTHPLPRITWMGKSSALEDGEKYSINVSEHKLIHRLLIKDCNQLDNGIYSAVAGITSCNARLVVQAEGDPASAGRPRKTTVGGGAQIDLEEVAREQQIKNREEMEKIFAAVKEKHGEGQLKGEKTLTTSGRDGEISAVGGPGRDGTETKLEVSGCVTQEGVKLTVDRPKKKKHTRSGQEDFDKVTEQDPNGLASDNVAREDEARYDDESDDEESDDEESDDEESDDEESDGEESTDDESDEDSYDKERGSGEIEDSAGQLKRSSCSKRRKRKAKKAVNDPGVHFICGFSDVSAIINESAELTCKLSSEDCEGAWFRDGRKISPDDNFSVTKDGAIHKLVIIRCEEEHSGKYRFEADSRKTEAMINVKDPPRFDPEYLIAFTEPVTVKAGHNAIFKLHFLGHEPIKIKWYSEGEELLDDNNTKIEKSASHSRLLLSRCQRKDTGEIKIKLKNEHGFIEAISQLIVLDKPTSPLGPAEVTEGSATCIEFKWRPPKNDGGSPVINYIMERRQVGRNTWKKLGEIPGVSSYRDTDVDHGRKYCYRIRAVTAEGTSEVMETDEIQAGTLAFPGPPAHPKVVSAYDDCINLSWASPSKTGGSRILGYILEKRKKGSNLWAVVNAMDELIKEKKYAVKDVVARMEYEFRVTAINLSGVGEFSNPSEFVFARDPKQPPGRVTSLKVTETSHTHFVLTWTKPEDKPGIHDEAKGYFVEIRRADCIEWCRCNTTLIITTSFSVKGLKHMDMYWVRVISTNDGGQSAPEELANYVLVMPSPVRPKFTNHKMRSFMVVKAGNSVRITVNFEASPLPHMMWLKDNVPVTKRVTISNSDGSSQLLIPSSERSDTGIYSILVKNLAGQETFSTEVRVTDDPKPPGPVELEENVPGMVTVIWEPSPDEKRDDRLHYTVTKLDSTKRTWTTVADRLFNNKFTVCNIMHGREYNFRVYAKNDMGISEPSESPTCGKEKKKEKFMVSVPTRKDCDLRCAPTFVVPLKLHTAPKGYECYMSCAVKGNPKPRVTWYRNYVSLNTNTNYYITNTCGVCSMLILHVGPKDMGEYTITAENALGRAECSTVLSVRGERETHLHFKSKEGWI